MKHPQNFYNLLFVIDDLCRTILKKLEDYKNNIENGKYVKTFYNIDFVYMHSIVLDVAKLVSATKKDKSGLSQLKKDSPQILRVRIDNFEKRYEDTIEKIKNNRNKIIAHIDISDKGSYFDMGFSKVEISRKIEGYKKLLKYQGNVGPNDLETIERLKKLESKSIKGERYSPSDFSKDVNKIKNMVEEILNIAHDVNNYYYKQS